MSNPLTTVRENITSALTAADLHAFTVAPEVVTPPVAFVGPADPYVTYEGATFGGEIVRHDVTLVSAAGANETTAEDLDVMLLATLDALAGIDHHVEDVDRPGRISLNGQTHLAVVVTVRTEIHR